MRTFEAFQRDQAEARYAQEQHNPESEAGARAILSQRNGKFTAQLVVKELAAQARLSGPGYLPSARLSAPLHVVIALCTIGVVEKAEDGRGRAWRYRLTAFGRKQAGL